MAEPSRVTEVGPQCFECGHSLIGLGVAAGECRCPECGTSLNIADVQRFASRPGLFRTAVLLATPFLISLGVTIVLNCTEFKSAAVGSQFLLLASVLLGPPAVAAWLASRYWPRHLQGAVTVRLGAIGLAITLGIGAVIYAALIGILADIAGRLIF